MAKVTGSCPKQGSGQFYVCQGNTTQFVGCCTIDPCADGSGNCPTSDLGYTSYSADSYDSITPQACVSTGQWWACKYTPTAFMGCCLTDPCAAGGCFGSNITAAMLSTNTTEAAPFMTSTADSSSSDDSSSVSTGGIVGIAIGSAMGALILGIILFTLYKRRGKNQVRQVGTPGQPEPNGTPGMYMPSPYQDSNGFPSPPLQNHGRFGSDKSFGYPNSPGQVQMNQRPTSVAPSWLSGRTSAPGHSSHPSVSSMGSSQGGLHFLFNQQRPQQQLNTVSEMDSMQIAHPVSELPGAISTNHDGHVYGMGYNRVATGEARHAHN